MPWPWPPPAYQADPAALQWPAGRDWATALTACRWSRRSWRPGG